MRILNYNSATVLEKNKHSSHKRKSYIEMKVEKRVYQQGIIDEKFQQKGERKVTNFRGNDPKTKKQCRISPFRKRPSNGRRIWNMKWQRTNLLSTTGRDNKILYKWEIGCDFYNILG